MKKRVIALGFFDGVHSGHAALLEKAVERATQYGVCPAVLTFTNHPDNLTGKPEASLIISPHDRAELIEDKFGITDVIEWPFDNKLMNTHWQEFLTRVKDELGAVHLIAGYDYRFGFNGIGDADCLREFCNATDIGCDIIGRVEIDGETVSSTLVRSLIKSGDMERAEKYLSHRYFITGKVETGEKLGGKIGSPTVNLHFPNGLLLPAYGVYATKTLIDGREYISVTNIGVRPTVSDENIPKAETHIFDFSENLYGKSIKVEFYKMLRCEATFTSVDELREQISKDIKNAKEYFSVN